MSQDLGNLDACRLGLDRPDEAVELDDRALTLARDAGLAKEETDWLRGRATAHRCMGRTDAAFEDLRSARPSSRRLPSAVMFTGAARKPPSLPICQTSTPGMFAKSRIRKRDWQPFSAESGRRPEEGAKDVKGVRRLPPTREVCQSLGVSRQRVRVRWRAAPTAAGRRLDRGRHRARGRARRDAARRRGAARWFTVSEN
jgi:hypothetical protein